MELSLADWDSPSSKQRKVGCPHFPSHPIAVQTRQDEKYGRRIMAGSLHAESIYTPCTKWRRIGIGKNNAKQRKREAKQKQRPSKRGKTAFFSFFLFLQEKKRKENSLLIQIEYYIFFKPSGFLPQMKGSGKSFVSCPTMTVRIKGKKQRHIRVRKKVNKTKCLLCFSSSFL